MELEAARFKAQEELKQKDDQLFQLKELLNTVINERNEAQDRYQSLVLRYHHPHRHQNHCLTTTPPPHSVFSSIEDEIITNGAFSSSDCEESIVSSSVTEPSSIYAAIVVVGARIEFSDEEGKGVIGGWLRFTRR
ncbi:hypothetical protein L1887_19428 [Cichorium endivia]|nr:hypothetical protein L1887_19428 [Cichorium endivia]